MVRLGVVLSTIAMLSATLSGQGHMSGRHEKFLLHAAQVAEGSQLEIKHGALLVRGGKTIGQGYNSDRSRMSSTPGDANMVALHSEVAAIHDVQRWVL